MHKSKIRIITFLTLAILLLSIPSTISTVAPTPYAMADYSDQSGTVDLATGDMSLTIPVMTVPGRGGMSYPISLNYKAGIRVHDESSWVGLGWNLGAGGITRSINALPDDYISGNGNNVRWYENYVTQVRYYDKVTKTNWFSSLVNVGMLVTTIALSGGPGAFFTTAAGKVSKSTVFDAGVSVGTSLLSPPTYEGYEEKAVPVPSVPQDREVSGYLKAILDEINLEGDTNPDSMHDINFPDSFMLSSPIYNGPLMYGQYFSETQPGVKPTLHPANAAGSPSEEDTWPGTTPPQSITDSIEITYETHTSGNENGHIRSFRVTDASGNIYNFGDNTNPDAYALRKFVPGSYGIPQGQAVTFSRKTLKPFEWTASSNCNWNQPYDYFEMYQLKPYTVEWGIKSIESGNSVNRIDFEYRDEGIFHDEYPRMNTLPDNKCLQAADGTSAYASSYINHRKIHKIISDTHVAVFWTNKDFISEGISASTEDREDGVDLNGNKKSYLRAVSLYSLKELADAGVSVNSIDLTDHSALKTVYFDYDFALMDEVDDNPSGNGRLTLRSLRECGTGSAMDCRNGVSMQTPETNFEYYLENIPKQDFETDRWGYFCSDCRWWDHNDEGAPKDFQYIWSLKKVNWPTGGSTEWTYEQDRYKKINNWFGDAYDPLPIDKITTIASLQPYEIDDKLWLGDKVYIDRDYNWETIPALYLNSQYIRTANNDKFDSRGLFLKFDITRDTKVYVAHDDRITNKPAWLNSFTDTGQNMISDDPDNPIHSVYEKTFPKGDVLLGGNVPPGWSNGDITMYTVFTIEENDEVIGREDTRYGGGIRVQKIRNCDGVDGEGECFETFYSYKNGGNDLDEDDGHESRFGNSESSGVAVAEPGTFEHIQDTKIEGGAYSIPKVIYSRVKVVPGYNANSAGVKWPYGYTVHTFSTPDMQGYEQKGEWIPPVSGLNLPGAPGNLRYGLGWKTHKGELRAEFSALPRKGILIGEKGNNLRLFYYRLTNYYTGEEPPFDFEDRAYYVDVQIPASGNDCNVKDFCNGNGCGCGGFVIPDLSLPGALDSNTYTTSNKWTNDNKKCTIPGDGNSPYWCPMLYDTSIADYQNLDPIMTFDWDNTPNNDRPVIVDMLNCVDDNKDDVCDLLDNSIPDNQKYSGSIDTAYKLGLPLQKTVHKSNHQIIASEVRTYSFEENNPYPGNHFPVSAWTKLDRVFTMKDGVVSSTDYEYDYVTGLPSKVTVYDTVGTGANNGREIITKTLFERDSNEQMRDSHRWTQVKETSVYLDSDTGNCGSTNNCKQSTRTIWENCGTGSVWESCDDEGSSNWWRPYQVKIGVGDDSVNSVYRLTSTVEDTDVFGNTLHAINHPKLNSPETDQETKFYYGNSGECDNDAGHNLFHALLTCTENHNGDRSQVFYDSKYRVEKIQKDISATDTATSYYYYDGLNRLTNVKDDFAAPGVPGVDLINYYYNFGTEGTCSGLSKSNSDCLNYVGTRTRVNQFLESHSVAYADGLGRSIQTASKKSPTESVFTDTFYNEISAVDSLIEPYVRNTGFTSEGLPNFRSDSTNPITVTESTKNYYENSPLARVEKVYSLIPTSMHDENTACGNGNPCVSTTFQASPNNRYARVVTDQLGLLSTSVFDKFGRIVETTNAMGGMGEIDYDELGRVLEVRQLKMMSTGNDFTPIQKYTYDARGRVKTAWTPEKGETTFKYDDNNNVIEKEENTDDAGIAGKVVGIEYDELNRPTISWVEGSGAARDGAPGPGDGQVISVNKYDSLTFDSNEDGVVDGNDWSCTNGLGKVCLSQNFIHNVNTFYKYDRRGRITHIREEIAQIHDNGVKSYGGVKVTMYGYNDDGSLDSVTTDVDGDSHRNSYLYNSLGQLYRIVINPDDPTPQYIQYNYNDDGTLDYVDYPNGLRQEYSYDGRNRVSGIEVFEAAAPSNKLFDEAYDAYDDANNLLEMTNQLSGSKAYFQYDDLNQLRTIQERGYYLNNHFVEEFDSDIVYNFDNVGNRKSRNTIDYSSGLEHDQIGRDTSLFAGTISNYEYEDETNKLISNDKCPGTPADPAFVYDPQGNMISKRCEVNMLPNGDFESGGIEHWMDWHQCTDPGCPFTDISRVWDGSSYAMRIETFDSESAQTARAIPDVTGKWITVSLDVKLDPSETISSYDEFSIWLYGGESSDPECHDLKTSDGTRSSTIDYTVDQNWNRISISVYVPKSCAQYSELYRLYFHPKAPTSDGRIVLVDNIQLELGSVNDPQYGDTSTTTYTYDENNMIEKVEVGRNDGVEETLEFRYDASGRRVLKLYKPEKTGPEQATLYWYGGESVPLLEEVVGDLPDLN